MLVIVHDLAMGARWLCELSFHLEEGRGLKLWFCLLCPTQI